MGPTDHPAAKQWLGEVFAEVANQIDSTVSFYLERQRHEDIPDVVVAVALLDDLTSKSAWAKRAWCRPLIEEDAQDGRLFSKALSALQRILKDYDYLMTLSDRKGFTVTLKRLAQSIAKKTVLEVR